VPSGKQMLSIDFETERYRTRELEKGTHRILPVAAASQTRAPGAPLKGANATQNQQDAEADKARKEQQSTTRQATP